MCHRSNVIGLERAGRERVSLDGSKKTWATVTKEFNENFGTQIIERTLKGRWSRINSRSFVFR